MRQACVFLLALALAPNALGAGAEAGLLVGWSSVSITPDLPVALAGQFHTRISKYVHDPVTATALAIESGSGESADQAVLVSCDLVRTPAVVRDRLRERLDGKLSGFKTGKLLLNATHTHTGPVTVEDRYEIPSEGVIQPSEYVEFLLDKLEEAVVEAWNGRQPAGVSWALSHAVVGYNRRAVYGDGKAIMYGKTGRADFAHLEGYEDHGVELLFFWTPEKRLTGILVNLACPSQVVEGEWYVSADFWHDVKVELRKRHSPDLFVFGMTGASGDQSPHLMLRSKAEETLRNRKGLSERQEIASRIAGAIDRVIDGARADIRNRVVFEHRVEDLDLPMRKVTTAEYEQARHERERLLEAPPSERRRAALLQRAEAVIDRYRTQGAEPLYRMELHAIRLGGVAIVSNPFELFLDFGIQMKARSPAEQTFIAQLAGAYGAYLPTQRAVEAGGYGAEIASNEVGPEGGKALVDRTVALLESMWK